MHVSLIPSSSCSKIFTLECLFFRETFFRSHVPQHLYQRYFSSLCSVSSSNGFHTGFQLFVPCHTFSSLSLPHNPHSLEVGWALVTPWTSLPGSSVHGISQARILECVSIPFSRGSSSPRD